MMKLYSQFSRDQLHFSISDTGLTMHMQINPLLQRPFLTGKFNSFCVPNFREVGSNDFKTYFVVLAIVEVIGNYCFMEFKLFKKLYLIIICYLIFKYLFKIIFLTFL